MTGLLWRGAAWRVEEGCKKAPCQSKAYLLQVCQLLILTYDVDSTSCGRTMLQAQQDAAAGRQREVHARQLQALQAQLATPPPTAAAPRHAAREIGGSRLSFGGVGGGNASAVGGPGDGGEGARVASHHSLPNAMQDGSFGGVSCGTPAAPLRTPFRRQSLDGSGGGAAPGGGLSPGSGWPASNPLFESPGAASLPFLCSGIKSPGASKALCSPGW